MPQFTLEKISSAHLFQALFTNTLQSVIMVNRNLQVLAFNDVFKNQVLIVRGKDIKIGDSFLDYIESENRAQLEKDFEGVFTGKQVDGIRKFFGVDGREFVSRYNYNPLKNEAGEIFAAAAFYQNITAEAEAQRMARESGTLLNLLFEQSHDGIMIYHIGQNEIKANPEFLKIFDLDSDSLKLEIQQFKPKGSWEPASAFSLSYLSDLPLKKEWEAEIISNRGQKVPVSLFKNEILDPSGSRILVLTVKDLTESYQTKKQLFEKEERVKAITQFQKEYLRQIIDVDPNFIFVKNREGKVLIANKSIVSFFECSEEEFLEKSDALMKTYHWKHEDVPLLENEVFDYAKTVVSEEAIFHKNTRRMHLFQVTRTPFLAEGQEKSMLYVGVDITDRVNAENELITQREYLRHILDTDPSLIFVKDAKGKYRLVNKAFADFYQMGVDDMIGKTDAELNWPEDVRMVFESSDKKVLESNASITAQETTINPISGRKAHFISTKRPLLDAEGNINILGVVTDISEQVIHEERLEKSEQMLQEIFNRVADALFIIDAEDLLVMDCNNQALSMFKGTDKSHCLGKPIHQLAPLQEPNSDFWTDFFYQLKYVNPQEEACFINQEGGLFWGNLAATQFQQEGRNLILLRISDISVQKESEEQIIQALHEKEILIQEIHHRVKNNMAVISSLLQLQTGYIKDPNLIEVFKDSQSRIKSMALIHEKLYQSKTLAKVEMDSYIKDLARTLLSTYNSRRANIRIHTDVDSVFLDINSAVPCGLIINEIVSNACKHAFKDREEGNIQIRFHKEGDHFRLELSDDGIGMPEGTDFSSFQSLGMNLVQALASQLGAQLEIFPVGGIRFVLIFSEKIKPVRDQVRPDSK